MLILALVTQLWTFEADGRYFALYEQDCTRVVLSAHGLIPPHNHPPRPLYLWTALEDLPAYYGSQWSTRLVHIGGFPYEVPPGKWLGITGVSFASKGAHFPGTDYLYLWEGPMAPGQSSRPGSGLLTLSEAEPEVSFDPPLPLPGGFDLTGAFSNAADCKNDGCSQNMNVLVQGYLSSDPLFRDCR